MTEEQKPSPLTPEDIARARRRENRDALRRVVGEAQERLMADAIIVVYTGTTGKGRTFTKWHKIGNDHAVHGALAMAYEALCDEAEAAEEEDE
jgi:hypothetical protein